MQPSRALLLAAGLLLLSACTRDADIPELPEGPQAIQGILRAAPLALDRRGTHILSTSGADVAYVESTTLHLRQYEGRTVTIHGIVQKNVDSGFLPVLIAEDVVVHDPRYRIVAISAMGIRFDVPDTWQQSGSGRRLAFRLPDTKTDLLVVTRGPSAPLPSGTALVVANKRAVRVQENGKPGQVVYVSIGDSTILLRLTPPDDAAVAAEANAGFIHLLTSLAITATQPTASGAALEAGSGSTLPCGGTAGILCPSGSYCAITDRQNNIGICAAIRKR